MPDVFTKHVTPGKTPQREQARDDQVRNDAGGYVFKTSDKTTLNRFLTLGTEGGTYYQDERKLTRDRASLVMRLAESSNRLLLDETLAVSEAGRAPRNNPALFALAAAAGLGSVAYRQWALDLLPRVARTGYHLLVWAEYIEMFRGWGPQLTKGVGKWYTSKTPEALAYQLLKYKQREGWSQRDLIRLSHFGRNWFLTPEQKALFAYVLKGTFDAELLPPLIDMAEQAHDTRSVKDWVRLVNSNRSLSHEMLPSEALAEKDVWEAMIANGNVPLGALLRNLARLTKLGVIGPMSPFNATITARLTNHVAIEKARIHPIAVLAALDTYKLGRSRKGSGVWTPVSQIVDALDEMFYLSFGNVVPSGKRTLISLDVSGSMWGREYPYQTFPDTACGLTPRDASAAMALVTMKAEPNYAVTAFSGHLQVLDWSPRQRLDNIIQDMRNIPMGPTDCSLPMRWAQAQQVAVDTFQIYTDNQTWYGPEHVHEALRSYRRFSGNDARLQVVAMTATDVSVADPADPGQLDVAGFDAAIPNLLADHSRGDL